MKEDITKELDAIQLRLDKGESLEEIINSIFRNTTTPKLLNNFAQEKTKLFDETIKEEMSRIYKPKLDGIQLSLEFKEDF